MAVPTVMGGKDVVALFLAAVRGQENILSPDERRGSVFQLSSIPSKFPENIISSSLSDSGRDSIQLFLTP